MKAIRNVKNGMNETTIENINITQRNILLTALFSCKEEHLNDDSDTGKIICKEITTMIDKIMGSMESY